MSLAGHGAGVRLVIAPEPAAWLGPVLQAGDVVVAPWASAASLPAGVRLFQVPGWRWFRGAAARVTEPLALKLSVRRAIDALVAKWVTPRVTEVIAPSLAAQRVFARLPNARKTLMADLPQLLALHDDLDSASKVLPHCGYLRHHRASQAALVQQVEESLLADEVMVRGHYARRALARAGVRVISKMQVTERPMALRHDPQSARVLLAGSTASRFGLEVALEAMASMPQRVLVARAAVGSEAASLRHPRLVVLGADEPVPPVSKVWAPAWVESTPAEVSAAVAAGIPTVATERAMGWLESGAMMRVMKPGAVQALL